MKLTLLEFEKEFTFSKAGFLLRVRSLGRRTRRASVHQGQELCI